MSLHDLLGRLRALDIALWMQGEELKLRAPKGALTPELTGELKARKAEIIRYLTEAAALAAPRVEGAGEEIPSCPRDLPLPLSFGQQRLWFLDRLEGPSATYTMPLAVRLEGPVDAAALDAALLEILRRHEVLRSNIQVEERQPVLRLRAVPDRALTVEPPTDAVIADLVRAEAERPFDLAQDPLLRARLVPLGGASHLLLLSMHHIVSDGWSLDLFLRELAALYGAFSTGRPSPLPPLPRQYVDFAHWQRQRLRGEALARLLGFWGGRLAGAPEVLPLPTDRPRPPVQTYRGATLAGRLEGGLAQRLRALGQASGATLFMTLLAGYALLLSRCCGQRDILVGTPIANRTRPEFEPLIGLFINMLVLRVDVDGQAGTRALLAAVRRTCLEAFEHQDLPFEQLVEDLKPARALSHAPLVQVAFQLDMPTSGGIGMPGLSLTPVDPPSPAAKFDLQLTVEDRGEELVALWTYNPDLFDEASIARMMDRYRVLLSGMAQAPEQPVATLPLLDPGERQALLAAAAGPATDYPRDRTVVELVEAATARSPDRIAITAGDVSLTYRQLMRRADALAAELRRRGVGPEVLVALCVDRSVDLLVGLLGILKAGGAYVPLDPAQPAERLSMILADAGPAVLLTQAGLRGSLPSCAAPVLCLDELPLTASGPRRLPGRAGPQNTAYVIYTSGSTGRPKGVRVGHRGLVNLLVSMQRETGFTAQDRLLAITTIGFDIAALEVFLPLISGSQLTLAARETVMGGSSLQDALRDGGINWLQGTPATYRLLLDAGWTPPTGFTALCGGEAMPVGMAREVVRRGVCFWNVYGPTETTIWSAARRVTPAPHEAGEGVEPIGGPLAHTQLHVLDPSLELTPLGVAGELVIGGDGLAIGYHGRPALTAERYIPDPFAMDGGRRLYRTGDLVRRGPDGTFQFLGRTDHQVKIRGFRIELGEIEAALRTHAGVKECVVLAREDAPGDKRLAAYLVPAGTGAPSVAELRTHLAGKLPDYMIPAAFVMLPVLPLNPNGKIDRAALPAPEAGRTASRGALAQPHSALEMRVAAVWRQVLGREDVGIDDNFFDLGGHSLLLAQVHEALRGEVTKPFPLVTLFQLPTIRRLAAWIGWGEDGAAVAPTPAPSRTAGPEGGAIAIIGMAGRFPGADDLESFWTNLRDGVESIRFFTVEELLAAGAEPELVTQPNYVRANGALSDVAGFDAGFFGVSPGEAEVMDPQHRLFLETAWHALEDAGYAGDRPGRIGVFAGSSHNGYLLRNLAPNLYAGRELDIQQIIVTNERDFLPTRVSYTLDLRGPSVNVQTACSTSLVAVHQACMSLLEGSCDMALAGAVGVKVPQVSGYQAYEGSIQSPDGHCRTFDAEANGTTWGSGVGVVLLKRLDAALADRDTIHAVIKGTAINNDGALKLSFAAPGPDGQAEVITAAQIRAGVEPASIGYVEAHGTGTRLGDPVEVAALTRAFRRGDVPPQSCLLGAVKPNIGHLDAAAGMAGLIKTVLALRHGQIPPTLHFRQPNPEIDFAASPFRVADRLTPWREETGPRRAGVSSFGIGGTNAHLVLEEAPPRPPAPPAAQACQLLILSARSAASLEAMRRDLAAHLRAQPDLALADVAFTLARGRRPFGHRLAVVASDARAAAAALEHAAPQQSQTTAGPVFLFPGQGSQFAGMGAELYRSEPAFRAEIDRCAELLRPEIGLDLRDLLYPGPAEQEAAQEKLAQTWLTQPALFATSYALARLWMGWGVRPAALIGHSLGEYVAACLAGVFTLETGLRLVARRGRLTWEQPPGAMLAVSAPAERMARHLGDAVALAAVNTPVDCVLAGPEPAITALAERLAAEEIPCRRLDISHAFHSPQMAGAAEPFRAVLAAADLKAPALPVISNLTGGWLRAEDATDPDYWVRHLLQPVRFVDGADTLLRETTGPLLEVGPGGILGSYLRRHPLCAADRGVLSTLRRPRAGEAPPPGGELQGLLETLGRLWAAGTAIDWEAVHRDAGAGRVPLPLYCFDRQRYWIDPPAPGALLSTASAGARLPLERWFHLPGWKRTLPPNLVASAAEPAAEPWLVFSDGSALADKLIERLRQAGHMVITVTAGESFRGEEMAFRIRPNAAEDYQTLVRSLGGTGFRQLVHLWALPQLDRAGEEVFDRAQQMGFDSLLILAGVLGEELAGTPQTITVIASQVLKTGDSASCPEKATILGPCLVIPQESPDLRLRLLDVKPEEGRMEALTEQLLAELHTPVGEPCTALRGHDRLVPSFDPVMLEPAGAGPGWLRPAGVYLITGGLGGVGLVLARWLAQTLQARLVLVGRTPLPDRACWSDWLESHPPTDPVSGRIRQLQAIEAAGGEVLLITADVTEESQTRAAFAQATATFGPIDGVIHAAGRVGHVPHAALLTEAGRREAEAQIATKVRSLYVLERILRDQPAGFCLVISSTSAVLGGIGFAAYAAANAFADAFVLARNRLGETAWISSNWDAWLFDNTAPTGGAALAMTPSESCEAMRRVLSCVTAGRIIIAVGDPAARFDQFVRLAGRAAVTAAPRGAHHERPDLLNGFAAPTDEVEAALAALWQELLGFTRVGIDDDFFELGGDSLLAIRLITGLKARFGSWLPVSTLLANPTIRGIAALLRRPAEDEAKADVLVALTPEQRAGVPFFCVPGTGGNVLYLRALARGLAEHGHPVYAFQALGVDGNVPPLTSIEEIAACNIRALRSVQPAGPYRLGGHSLGSWIAYEMARQLIATGERVSLVAVLDTGCPGPRDTEAREGWDNARWIVAIADIMAEMYCRPHNLRPADLHGLSWHDQVAALAEVMQSVGAIAPGTEVESIRGFVEVYATQARLRYEPPADTRMPIILFKAQDGSEEFLAGMPASIRSDPSWGWEQFSAGPPPVIIVPGNHHTMLTRPYVDRLAHELAKVLPSAAGHMPSTESAAPPVC